MDFKKIVLPKNNLLKITEDRKFIVLFKVNSEKSMYVSGIRPPNLDEFSGIGLVSFTSDINNAKVFTYQELHDSEVKFFAFRETIIDLLPDCYHQFLEVIKKAYIYERPTVFKPLYLSETELSDLVDYGYSSKEVCIDYVDVYEDIKEKNSRKNYRDRALSYLMTTINNSPDFNDLTIELYTKDTVFMTFEFKGLTNYFDGTGFNKRYETVKFKPDVKLARYTKYRNLFQNLASYLNVTSDSFNLTLNKILTKLFSYDKDLLNNLNDLDMRVETK